ncbi:MAG: hypothetical protein AMXMBFR46_17880 [Acidimicrobiia bacterium]
MRTAVERVLDADEEVAGRGRCWAAARRKHVPLLFLGRHQYDVWLTDRRVVLFGRRRFRRLRSDDVALARRFESLTLLAERQRIALLQHQIRTADGSDFVIEWRPRHRTLGRAFGASVRSLTRAA